MCGVVGCVCVGWGGVGGGGGGGGGGKVLRCLARQLRNLLGSALGATSKWLPFSFLSVFVCSGPCRQQLRRGAVHCAAPTASRARPPPPPAAPAASAAR